MERNRECRVCFETDEITPFLTPCNCRGTHAYIHTHCLALYIRHFPDGVCRVCRTQMKYTHDDFPYCFGTFGWMLALAYGGTIPSDPRGMYLMLVAGLILYYLSIRGLPLRYAVIGMVLSASFLFFSQAALFWILASFTGVFTALVMWMYVPTGFLLAGLAIFAAAFYSSFIVVYALTRTEPTLAALLVCVLGTIWYLMIRARPPLRIL